MSRKIIGITVGTQLPKPNFKQTDPTKGDYIKNKPDFEGLKNKVDNGFETINSNLDAKADIIDGKVPASQLPDSVWEVPSWSEISDRPTKVSDFSNDAGFVQAGSLPTVATTGQYTDLEGIPTEFNPASHDHPEIYYTKNEINMTVEQINSVVTSKASQDKVNELIQNVNILSDTSQKSSNLVTSISSTSDDTQYPSAKAVYDAVAAKQDKLEFDSELIDGSGNPVTSGVVKEAVDGVIEIASGKCKTYVFDSYEELSLRLSGDENGDNQDTVLLASLKTGDVLLIRALYEPDFWWEEVKTRAMVRANFEPEIIVSGYGVARVLETTKCDLTNYALKSDIPTTLSALNDDSSHRLVTDAEKTAWNAKSNFSGSYNDLTNKPTIPSAYTHPDTHPAAMIEGLSTVATSGSYNDLANKPSIPNAYTHPANHPASMITGLATVATSGSYNDLSNKPTIPTVPSSLPANGGNADTVDNMHIRTGTTGAAGYITFVV